jgi:hypothetical protein
MLEKADIGVAFERLHRRTIAYVDKPAWVEFEVLVEVNQPVAEAMWEAAREKRGLTLLESVKRFPNAQKLEDDPRDTGENITLTLLGFRPGGWTEWPWQSDSHTTYLDDSRACCDFETNALEGMIRQRRKVWVEDEMMW